MMQGGGVGKEKKITEEKRGDEVEKLWSSYRNMKKKDREKTES